MQKIQRLFGNVSTLSLSPSQLSGLLLGVVYIEIEDSMSLSA